MKKEELHTIKAEVAECKKCPVLCENRMQTVFDDGNPEAKIIFIGEAPGQQEAEQGKPFVGPAGQLFANILAAMGLNRSKVFMANTVCCRPPNNRVPHEEEKANCRGFLDRQIAIINPVWLVCLGSVASQSMLGQNIEACRGQVVEKDGRKILAAYHPAAILWENDVVKQKAKKLAIWNDLAPLREWLEKNKA